MAAGIDDAFFLAKLWMQYRPLRRLRAMRNRIRARHGKPPLPGSVDDEPQEVPQMNETQLTILRTLLKIVGTVLVTHGVIDAKDVPGLQMAVEGVVGGLGVIIGTYWSHKSAVQKDALKAVVGNAVT